MTCVRSCSDPLSARHPPTGSRAETGASVDGRPSVLLVTHVGIEPREALIRASAMRDVLGGELKILRFVGGASYADERVETHRAHDETRIVAATLRWCRTVLRDEMPDDVVVLRDGNFTTALVRAARAARASMLVLPHTKSGRLVRHIVRRTKLPLLIARRLRGKYRAVVAATDFTDRRYPVLHEALRLGRGWVAPTVFMHNVLDSTEVRKKQFDQTGTGILGGALESPDRFTTRISEFERVDRALRARCRRILLSRQNTVRAIFEVSEREDADLIVVGTHTSRKRASRRGRPSVASGIIGCAASSVLVVPVTGAGYPSWDEPGGALE